MEQTLAKKIRNARLIIVHGGKTVHFDEFTACAIARAVGCTAPIERRDPTEEELNDDSILVMDVGGRFQPCNLNFDHHQLSRDNRQCAYWLLAETLEVIGTLIDTSKWAIVWSLIDTQGPSKTALDSGLDFNQVQKFLNPVAGYALELWGEDPNGVGEKLLAKHAASIKVRLEKWKEFKSLYKTYDMFDVRILDLRGLDEYSALKGAAIELEKANVVIYDDDRGPGLAFFRINDCPSIDFSKCLGLPYCGFASPSGFILKTTIKDISISNVISDALV